MKKNNYIIYICLFLTVSISSCKKKEIVSSDAILGKILIDNKKTSSLDINAIGDFDKIILLETIPESMIGEIEKVFLTDLYIVIWDSKMHRVLCFDFEGNFIRCIGKNGGGPEEYIKIADVYMKDENCISILDSSTKRIIEYNIIGEYNSSYQLQEYLYSFYPDENGFWGINGYQNDQKYDLIYISSETNKIEAGFFPGNSKIAMRPTNHFVKNEISNEILFHSQYIDVIYKIESKNVIPWLWIDFGDKRNPYTDLTSSNIDVDLASAEFMGHINNLHIYKDNLFFSFHDYHGLSKSYDSYNVYVSLNNMNSIVYQYDIKHSPDLKIQPLPDIVGLSKGKLIYQINPEFLPENIFQEKYAGTQLENITSESNPLLVLYNLK
ncbi:6-bladed beta-propeller [Bacteroides sp. 519]|uniref:6-bladed beta-propeller n=1 Tax=Bacteroides sp. 519 TaxID=2302937 RepID=UPI0013D77292|nr:6-bladed beta-propeller [Bacteroides sp. 519]NDV58504.1 6-bladed beta-propeller [Bacteroides sp. 519]